MPTTEGLLSSSAMIELMQEKELRNTVDEGVRLWGLVQRYAKLEIVEHLSYVLTIFILGGILFALCSVAVYCFCMWLVTVLEAQIGNLALSYAIVGLILLVIGLIVFLLRKTLISAPLIKSLMKEMFEEKKKAEPIDDEETTQHQ